MQPVILFQVGIQGHVPQLAVFERVFGIPVVPISLTENVAQAVREAGTFSGTHYSFPDYWRSARPDLAAKPLSEAVDVIAEYERTWGFSAASLVAMDRDLREAGGYEATLRNVALLLRFADQIMREQRPLFSKGNITTFFGLALQRACLAHGVPCPKPQTSRLPNRVEFQDETANGYMRGWKATYSALCRSDAAVPRKTWQEADEWLENFRNRPGRPSYAIRNSVTRFDPRKAVARLIGAGASKFSRRYWEEILGQPVARELGYAPSFGKDFVQNFLSREWRAMRLRMGRHLEREPDLTRPFAYFPLQFFPEIATLVYGAAYEDQANAAEQVARSLPAGMKLYVKDHTSMFGRRPLGFYERLSAIWNVEVLHPEVDTFKLIKNSRMVVTISGTTGWEAFILSKPVVVLGQVFYGQFPNVLEAAAGPHLARQISTYLDGFSPDEEMIRRAVTAFFHVAPGGVGVGDIGEDVSAGDAITNAEILALAFRSQLDRFPLKLLTQPPNSSQMLTPLSATSTD